MRKVFITAAALMLVLAHARPAAARDLPAIEADGQFRLCFVAWSPMSADVDTNFGPDYELAAAFVKSLGLSLRERRVRGSDLFADASGKIDTSSTQTPFLLASDSCDLYATNITVNAWRQKQVDIVPVYPGKTLALVRGADRSRYQTPADLAGRTTYVRRLTTYYDWLTAQNAGPLKANPIKVELSDKTVAVHDLISGRVDFQLWDTLQALHFIERHRGKVAMAFPIGPTELLGWAIRKGDVELRGSLEAFLDGQRKKPDSEMNRIFQRYFDVSLQEYESLIYASQPTDD